MALNNPLKGDSARRLGAHFETLKVSAQHAPNLTVAVSEGAFWLNDVTLVEFYGGNLDLSGSVPGSNARWTAVVLTAAGSLKKVDGAISVAPAQPVVAFDELPLALVYIEAGTTAVTNDMIMDARPVHRSGSAIVDHDRLTNRNHTDAHNIASITGLQAALDSKVDLSTHTSQLATKADQDGTDSDTFTLNKDFTGTPAAEVRLVVNRGSSTDVEIRWNESNDQWEFTNDGATYYALPTTGISVGADEVTFSPTGDLASTDVQAALAELDTEKAPKASPVFTTSVQLPVYADLAAIDAAIVSPVEGQTVLVTGQGLAFYTTATSPDAWVLAADGSTLVV